MKINFKSIYVEGKFIHVHDFHVSCDWFWGIERKEWDSMEEVMDWMITYQDVRRNMCGAEKIYANDKVSARRIEEENVKKRLEGNRKGAVITNGHSVSVHLDGERKSHTFSTHTREQRAKIAGVSSGTVARYDTVMKFNTED